MRSPRENPAEVSEARSPEEDGRLTRRAFLKAGFIASVPFLTPPLAFSDALALPAGKRALSFFNTHTGETLATTYWERGKYLSKPLAEINHILRDHRTGEVMAIDPNLMDVLHAMRMKMRTQQPFHIISGYRSRETNAWLCSMNRGVAPDSLHLYGKAVDIRMPGFKLARLRRLAMDLKRGGVGFYPRSDFIHVDVGPVRSW